MKKGSFFKKLLLLLNCIVALLLVLSFFVSILPQEKFILFSVLGLTVPVVIACNIFFALYWMYKRNTFFIISFIVLVIGYFVISPIFKFEDNSRNKLDADFSVMTFNTRSFNENKVINRDNIDSLIIDFVEAEDPDVVCFQEFYYAMKRSSKLDQYPYKFIDFIYGENNGRVIQAVYSKFQILRVEPIEFPKSANSAIFADILVKKDTVRIYNVHLQSFSISPEVSTIQNQDSKRLFGRIKKVMKLQKEQVGIIKNHYNNTTHKTILVGDYNNTAFSNIYYSLREDFNDTFLEAGKGFGRTYDLKGLPMRIDYIMADDSFEILQHQNYDVKLSDHYPIKATLKIKDQ